MPNGLTASAICVSTVHRLITQNYLKQWEWTSINEPTLIILTHSHRPLLDSSQYLPGEAHLCNFIQVANWPSKNIPKFNLGGKTGKVIHYTQMAWADTTRIGCGYISFMDKKNATKPYRRVKSCLINRTLIDYL